MDGWTVIYMLGFVITAGLLCRQELDGLDRLPSHLRKSWDGGRSNLYLSQARTLVGAGIANKMRACQWAGLSYFVALVLSLKHDLWVDLGALAVCALMTIWLVRATLKRE